MRDSIIFEETTRYEITVKNFHLMLKTSCAKDKWESFSEQTKENIFRYLWYSNNLLNPYDDDYGNWSYWRTAITAFVTKFDESNPKYDGNFEYVALGKKR